MKELLISILILIINNQIYGQLITTKIKDFEPKQEYNNINVTPLHSDENSSVFLIFIKQGVKKHMHQYHTEVVTVLEGKGTMYLGESSINISPGDHIVIPQNTPHAVITTSNKPLKVISVQSPEFIGEDRIFIDDEKEE
ncbi:MAG: cupin domain-containing protein [Saprospiraceae bacterium]|nr:cupin domain-containing protein [Saprospiraceae bacterium]